MCLFSKSKPNKTQIVEDVLKLSIREVLTISKNIDIRDGGLALMIEKIVREIEALKAAK